MSGRTAVRWSVKEITECLRERQTQKFDANIGVSGLRGNGKSTFLFKIFNSFLKQGFRPMKHQVYSQEDVTKLLSAQKFGFCWDDEAINSGYKRDFAKVGQIELIKVITNYRDNFNIYGSAIPFFYNLDKALRELIFMHVHIVQRGVGVILLPLDGQIHSQDPWDTMTNKKIEAQENLRLMKNAESKFRYQRLTTFAGFVYFGPMTARQEERYKKIKDMKRKTEFGGLGKEKPKTFLEKMYTMLVDGRLTREGMMQACYIEGAKYTSACKSLNAMLNDNGIVEKTMSDFIVRSKNSISSSMDQINQLVPSF